MNKKDENDLKQGYWEEDEHGLSESGRYINGLRDGEWLTFMFGDELILSEFYRLGEKHGITTYFDYDSIDSTEEWENGIKHGISLHFHEGGEDIFIRRRYVMGELDPLEFFYYGNGDIDVIFFSL